MNLSLYKARDHSHQFILCELSLSFGNLLKIPKSLIAYIVSVAILIFHHEYTQRVFHFHKLVLVSVQHLSNDPKETVPIFLHRN